MERAARLVNSPSVSSSSAAFLLAAVQREREHAAGMRLRAYGCRRPAPKHLTLAALLSHPCCSQLEEEIKMCKEELQLIPK